MRSAGNGTVAKSSAKVDAMQVAGEDGGSAGSTSACGSESETELADVAPNDLDAEGIVLAHALEHGPIDGLLPKHFYSDANRRIYEAVRMLQVRGEPIDVVAVKRELQKDNRLAQVGGVTYLAVLTDRQPWASEAHVKAHAEAIRELYRRRVLSDAALKLRVELRAGEVESGAAWARFKEICDGITNP
jgi:replicative DNA helicase